MERLEAIVAELPEAERVDIEAWDDHPSFRVRGKNFVFADETATSLGLKLTKDEAVALVASDDRVHEMGYGLGRHGWVSLDVAPRTTAAQWDELREWIRISYTLVAPKKLARVVLEQDGVTDE